MLTRRPIPHTFAQHSRCWDYDCGAMRRQRWDDVFRMAALLALVAAVLMSLTRCAVPLPALLP